MLESGIELGAMTIHLRYLSIMIDESLHYKVSSLSPADRLKLIGVVWDTLLPDDLPVTDAERALLDARLADNGSASRRSESVARG